ncbi:hypothetical protein [Pseudochelatococcus sp. G4_1912]|uniref:hypothetical protein n=1 Tax=Pseudochelatococcus sp. G4_1912 TaxID=3114288 RepID=UPI0039C5BD22
MARNAYCNTSRLSAREAVDATIVCMGNVLFDASVSNGACTIQDLLNAGFTCAEIIEHIEDAREYAARRLALQDA